MSEALFTVRDATGKVVSEHPDYAEALDKRDHLQETYGHDGWTIQPVQHCISCGRRLDIAEGD